MEKGINIRYFVLVLALFMLVMLPVSVSKSKNPNEQDEHQSFTDMQSVILPPPPPVDRIEDNCVVTRDKENVTGKLPPANPAEVIYRGNPDLMRVAITIDDGWNADMRILDLLKAWEIKWTAFLIGGRNLAESHPEFVKRIEESGGEVCNHTYSHSIMTGRDQAFVTGEIENAQRAITRVTGKIYPYVRFCGGSCDATALSWASGQGYWVVHWTIDSEDTRRGILFEQQVNTILSSVRPGAILLFHFGGYNTYKVLATVIPEMQSRGYEVTSLSRVLEGTPYQLKDPEAEAEKAKEREPVYYKNFIPVIQAECDDQNTVRANEN
ncbi:MAG: polysaccharide deacetylase family protein [Actinobacteria bacterium]|nr:polysaccharide deacetylase family protein [Actinomycetota bacterium]